MNSRFRGQPQASVYPGTPSQATATLTKDPLFLKHEYVWLGESSHRLWPTACEKGASDQIPSHPSETMAPRIALRPRTRTHSFSTEKSASSKETEQLAHKLPRYGNTTGIQSRNFAQPQVLENTGARSLGMLGEAPPPANQRSQPPGADRSIR